MGDHPNDERDSFGTIASVAHELRTPLTAIQGAVEVLRDEAAGTLSPEQREFVNLAHRNLERLRNRIEDALDIAELRQQDLSQSVPLDLTLASASIAMRAAIETGTQVNVAFEGFSGQLALSIPESALSRTLASLTATVSRHAATSDVIVRLETSSAEARFEIIDSSKSTARGNAPEYVVIHDASLAMAREVIGRHQGTLQTATSGRCGVYVHLPLRSIEDREGH